MRTELSPCAPALLSGSSVHPPGPRLPRPCRLLYTCNKRTPRNKPSLNITAVRKTALVLVRIIKPQHAANFIACKTKAPTPTSKLKKLEREKKKRRKDRRKYKGAPNAAERATGALQPGLTVPAQPSKCGKRETGPAHGSGGATVGHQRCAEHVVQRATLCGATADLFIHCHKSFRLAIHPVIHPSIHPSIHL